MPKDFLEELKNGIMVENQLFIMNSKPTDIRQNCNNVQDFQDIAARGLELRYSGLITFELDTSTFKGCIKNTDGTFTWVILNGETSGELDPNNFALKDHKHSQYVPKISTSPPLTGEEIWIDIGE